MSKNALNAELDPELKIESSIVAEILQFWRNARANRPMPARADINPVDLGPKLLPHILLLDVEHRPRLRFRWRLIGTHTTEVYKRDMTGAYWDEIYSDEVMASLRLRADWVLEHRLPLRSVGHATSSERDFESHEALYMPLSDDGETINMMLLASIYTFSSRA